MKRLLILTLTLVLLARPIYQPQYCQIFPLYAQNKGSGSDKSKKAQASLAITTPSVILMEAETGTILYQSKEHTVRPPASVTKIMTLDLIFDAIDKKQIALSDEVTVSEHAAGMGGSQVYLEAGEVQTVETLIKCISVASANDACVAMAEHICGSEEEFVAQMNQKAAELGMNDTHFANSCGLEADGHVTSAYDIALMSRELITKHPQIHDYCTIWMENIIHNTRRGAVEFGLANTNKLLKQYPYATGLKTGYTSAAKFCISATAEKDGLKLIAAIMAAPDKDKRTADAQTLLNYGFAGYTLTKIVPETPLAPVPVALGTQATVQPVLGDGGALLLERSKTAGLQQTVTLAESVEAPVALGDSLGALTVTAGDGGEVVAEIPLLAGEEIPRVTFWQMFLRTLRMAFLAD